MKHALSSLFLIGITVFSPFPVVLLVMLIAIVRFRAYGAVILSAFLYDALYFGGTVYPGMPFGYMIPLTLYMLGASAAMVLIRTRLRDYAT